MSDRHDEFRDWSGAYALGALESDERRAFEEHLEHCQICTDEVRSLLPLHGLLAQLERADVGTEPDPAIADSVAARARREQHTLHSSRRRWRMAAVSSAAALIVLAVAGIVLLSSDDAEAPGWAEGPTVAAAITSTQADSTWISTSSRGWGTEIHVDLLGLPQRSQYQLWVVDVDGTWTQSSTWGPTPSGGAEVTGATSVKTEVLARIVITSQDRDEILIDATA